MLIDLNGFKQINDTLGHQFGDLVLTAAAQRLRDAVRDSDVVGRWGGDEFVILLPGIEDGTAVRNSAERIGSRLSSTPIVGDVSISAAVGAALFPRHGATLDDLVRAADVAMYGAKSTGVTHRLADAMTTELVLEAQASASGYAGPDRRRAAPDGADHG
jgi:diguanylate cyclase (GGDEF)-like protein